MKRYVIIAGVNGAGKTTLYSTEDIYKYIIIDCIDLMQSVINRMEQYLMYQKAFLFEDSDTSSTVPSD